VLLALHPARPDQAVGPGGLEADEQPAVAVEAGHRDVGGRVGLVGDLHRDDPGGVPLDGGDAEELVREQAHLAGQQVRPLPEPHDVVLGEAPAVSLAEGDVDVGV
jgi:hypothetical protein